MKTHPILEYLKLTIFLISHYAWCHISFFNRILLFNAGLENPEMLGDFEEEIAFPELGRVFAIDYNSRGE